MKYHNYLIVCLLTILLTSCKDTPKKELPLVNMLDNPTGAQSSLPYLYTDRNKTLMSWVEGEGDSLVVLKYSELNDSTWLEPKEIIRGTDWFVNWADFPVIVENDGNLLSHVLKKSTSGTYSYDVKLNVLPKGEGHWRTDLPLNNDGTPTEHGFVTALPYTENSFFVCWLDGRNTVAQEGEAGGPMTIRASEVDAFGNRSNETELDVSTCDCCQTTAAITDNGPVVIYRDRSEEEIRDISIVRKVAGEWTAPKTIFDDHWQIKGCPVNGPKAAAMGNALAIAWFTAAQEKPIVKLIFSEDGGAHFDAPIPISATNAMGRVDVLLLDGQTAIVSWMETHDDHAALKVIKVNRNGQLSNSLTIIELDASRSTGFPQMALLGDKVLFAWTDVTEAGSSVKTAYVSVGRF
ncbi:MAG: hypothetical protein MUO53_05440 [Maribacter sp.]|nr:hypothetical protein [Maribacter sp.]